MEKNNKKQIEKDSSVLLPKNIDQLEAMLFTAYLLGRDDEKNKKRIFSDWFNHIFKRQ